MTELPFNEGILETLADSRTELLDTIFRFLTFWGGEDGYIILILAIYWLYDKNLGFKAALITLTAAIISLSLKLIIKNPRPFVTESTYEENWAVSSSEAEELILEYSTPSTHAFGTITFWTYLSNYFDSRRFIILAAIMVALIGFSRPYLGVHYVEDVILGWVLGLVLVYFFLRFESDLDEFWNLREYKSKVVIALLVPSVVWILAGLIGSFDERGTGFATFAGFVSGLLIGYETEKDHLNFDPEIKTSDFNPIVTAVGRFIIGFTLTFGTIIGLDLVFESIADDDTSLGYLLRYVRYTLVSLVASIGASFTFLKSGLSSEVKIK